jgi:hypothetical protein
MLLFELAVFLLLSDRSAGTNSSTHAYLSFAGVGLGRVVRKVRQHPDDHEFESQQWQ